jgi:two-component system response regulator PrrA
MPERTAGEPPARVLVVDDDQALRTALDRGLTRAGFEVLIAADAMTALTLLRRHPVAALLLDVAMPGMDGVALTRRLRADGDDVPICILSARGDVDDRVAGLQAGADDYVPKPFVMREVNARLHALLRRRGDRVAAPVRTVGDLRVEPEPRRASRGGVELILTRREFDLLEVLAVNSGIVLSRAQLLRLVWGYDIDIETNVVDVFVGYLRRKLEATGGHRMIHTVRGVGFVLRP